MPNHGATQGVNSGDFNREPLWMTRCRSRMRGTGRGVRATRRWSRHVAFPARQFVHFTLSLAERDGGELPLVCFFARLASRRGRTNCARNFACGSTPADHSPVAASPRRRNWRLEGSAYTTTVGWLREIHLGTSFPSFVCFRFLE